MVDLIDEKNPKKPKLHEVEHMPFRHEIKGSGSQVVQADYPYIRILTIDDISKQPLRH